MIPMTQTLIQALINDHKRRTERAPMLYHHSRFNGGLPGMVPYTKQLLLAGSAKKKALKMR
jgi:hypothetical protein